MGGGTRTLEIPLMAQASLATLGSSCHPPLLTQVALVVFAVHTLVAQENALDAEKAFVTLTVLSILNKAQAFLPFSIHSVVQVRLGERRPLGGALQGCGRLGPHLHPPTHPQPRAGDAEQETNEAAAEVVGLGPQSTQPVQPARVHCTSLFTQGSGTLFPLL